MVIIVALLLPREAGETAEVKLSADLAHLLAFLLGWLSSQIVFGPDKAPREA